jgi:hypothetical protein
MPVSSLPHSYTLISLQLLTSVFSSSCFLNSPPHKQCWGAAEVNKSSRTPNPSFTLPIPLNLLTSNAWDQWACVYHNTVFTPTPESLPSLLPQGKAADPVAVAVAAVAGVRAYGAPRNWSAIRPASRTPLRKAPWTVAGYWRMVCSPAKNTRGTLAGLVEALAPGGPALLEVGTAELGATGPAIRS